MNTTPFHPMKVFIVFVLLLCMVPSSLFAATVSVSAIVSSQPTPPPEHSTLVFQGQAYPNALIRLYDGAQSFWSTADSTGHFQISVNLLPKQYTFTLFAQTADQLSSPPIVLSMNIKAQTITQVSNLWFGPVMTIDHTPTEENQYIVLSGVTTPHHVVRLFSTESPGSILFETTADALGRWQMSVAVEHIRQTTQQQDAHLFVQAFDGAAYSESSFTVFISLPQQSETPQPPEQPSTPDPCLRKLRSDITCDGEVDLIDFQILVLNWKKNNTHNRADINTDNVVNVFDLSIMMQEWTVYTYENSAD